MRIKLTSSYRKVTASKRTAGGTVMPPLDPDKYPKIDKLEGPFRMRSGRVVYYDPAEGKYYDLRSDMYLSDEESMEFWEKTSKSRSAKPVSGGTANKRNFK